MASKLGSHVILSAAKNPSSIRPLAKKKERFFAALRMTCLEGFWPPLMATEYSWLRLCHRSDSGKTLVHHSPEGFYCLGLVVKKVLEKPRIVKGGRIGVPLTIFTQLTHPISGFTGIEYLEQAARVEIRPAGVIQNPIVITFDSYDDVRLSGRQIFVPCISPPQFDRHRRLSCISNFPMPLDAWTLIPTFAGGQGYGTVFLSRSVTVRRLHAVVMQSAGKLTSARRQHRQVAFSGG
ncbi:MAG: hypothetical protein ACLQOO_16945 [Terriglobia bacterium]